MADGIQGHVNNATNKKSDCHTSVKAETSDKLEGEKPFVKDFEPKPNASAYDGDDNKLSKENESFILTPSVGAVCGNDKLSKALVL
ncbi:hypothetical protein LguiA_008935 [Lonicera macranthoides]